MFLHTLTWIWQNDIECVHTHRQIFDACSFMLCIQFEQFDAHTIHIQCEYFKLPRHMCINVRPLLRFICVRQQEHEENSIAIFLSLSFSSANCENIIEYVQYACVMSIRYTCIVYNFILTLPRRETIYFECVVYIRLCQKIKKTFFYITFWVYRHDSPKFSQNYGE